MPPRKKKGTQVGKLPDSSKPKRTQRTEAEELLDRVRRAKKVRENWEEDFRVTVSRDYIEGRQRPPNVPAKDWITLNMIYSVLLSELPSLYQTDPYYYVKLAKTYTVNPMDIALFEKRAQVRQAMLNYLKRECELKDKSRLAIFDAFPAYGIVKVHYQADFIENEREGEIQTDEMGAPVLDDQGFPIEEPEFILENEQYKITRVHPDDFWVDEDAGPLDENVRLKIHRIKMDYEDFKEDKRYRKEARDKVKPTEEKSQADRDRERRKKGSSLTGYNTGAKPKEPEVVVLYEVWDCVNERWCTLADGYEDFVSEWEEIPAGIERDPFVDLRWTKRDDSWYPLPPVSQWIDPQREYNEVRSKMMVHRKRYNRKYTVYSAGLANDPQTEMSKLITGEDGTCIEVSQPGIETVLPIKDAPLDQQVHVEYAYLRNDFTDLAVGNNQRGAGAGVDSATEAGIIEKRTVLREGDRVGSVIEFLTRIGRKLDQLVQANITADQAVRVTGADGAQSWMMVKQDSYEKIAGEYEYTIDVGTYTPQLPEIERAQFLGLITALTNAPMMLLSRSMTQRMAKMFHIENEAVVDELMEIGKQWAQGMLPQAGGSPPGITQNNPATKVGGAAVGINNIRGGS